MIRPEFPFRGKQIMLSSDRLVLHTKSDAIFLFGNGAVSLSSPQTINLDSKEKVLVNSPKIELGEKAELDGEPLLLGVTTLRFLMDLLLQLEITGTLLAQASESDLGASMEAIKDSGKSLGKKASQLRLMLDVTKEENMLLSKTTYTL